TQRILVKIEEGPRYRCGSVRVTGAHKMQAPAIINALTVTRDQTQAVQQVFVFRDYPPTNPPPTEAGLAQWPDNSWLWLKDQPAHFSEFALRRLTLAVTNTLREHGFFFPEVNVSVAPDPATRI